MTRMTKQRQRERRHRRIRARLFGTARRPRLSVFRSSRFIYSQLIDDEKGKTLFSLDDRSLTGGKKKLAKTARAVEVGKLLAREAKAKKINQVVFDRAGFTYTGRIKALAQAARGAGLKF